MGEQNLAKVNILKTENKTRHERRITMEERDIIRAVQNAAKIGKGYPRAMLNTELKLLKQKITEWLQQEGEGAE